MSEGALFVTVMYGLIGFTGAASIVVFVWGFVTYIARIGTVRREDGIDIMEWSVGLAITAIVLIGLLRLIQHWFGLA